MSLRHARAVLLSALVVGCSSTDSSAPLSGGLWADPAPVLAAGASSLQATVHLGRPGTISYSVYTTVQAGFTAAQVREDAAGGTTRTPVKKGTAMVSSAQVATGVAIVIPGLTAGTTYYLYMAADPTDAMPVPTDLDAVRSANATLAARQPAISYTSTAVPGTIGYYAYLPEDHYLKPADRFPLLVFLHGSGEKGNGTTELSRVLVHGPPKLVNGGRNFPFIIISPQLPASQGGWPVNLVDELIARAKTDYRVDTTRIYITGLSMGGYGTWAYAVARPTKIAAVVPIAGAGSNGQACLMKDVPTWAFHGDADGTVNVSGSVTMVNAINACAPAPAVAAKLTIYQGVGHDSWTRTYDGTAGHDVFAWMLQYHR